MGLSEFFSNFKERQKLRKVEKLTSKLCEKYNQDYERYAAADELFEIGTYDALYGLLKRFASHVPNVEQDDKEKRYVLNLLYKKGEDVLPPLIDFIKSEDEIVYPLQLLKKILGKEETLNVLKELVESFSAEYDRDPSKKIEVIKELSTYKSPEVGKLIFPFLDDPNDDVVLATIDAFKEIFSDLDEEDREKIREKLLNIFLSDEEKPRVERKILDFFMDLKLKVTGFKKSVAEKLEKPYYLDKKGHIKKLGMK